MGAWGTGNFQNDDALDWLGELGDFDTVRAALRVVADAPADAHLDAPVCCAALAAAEVVAAAKGAPAEQLPDEVDAWVKLHGAEHTTTDVALASAAAARVESASELKDLFDDGATNGEWHSVVLGLRERLRPQSG